MTDLKKTFWVKEDWPDDVYGYSFLARAVKLAGRALYADWTGEEPYAPEPLLDLWAEAAGKQFLKPQSQVSQATVNSVRRMMEIHAPDKIEGGDVEIARKLQPSITARDAWRTVPAVLEVRSWRFTPQSWLAGAEVVKAENERRRSALGRLSGTQNFIKAAIRDGKLTYVLAHPDGGRLSEPMPAEWWNVKDASPRFLACRMLPRDPSSQFPAAGVVPQDIFVSRHEFETLLRSAIPLSRPKSSEEMESLHVKATAIYDEMLSRTGTSPSRNSFETACKVQGISTTVARDVHGQKHAQRSRN